MGLDIFIDYANPTNHFVETCTDHTDGTRSECNALIMYSPGHTLHDTAVVT